MVEVFDMVVGIVIGYWGESDRVSGFNLFGNNSLNVIICLSCKVDVESKISEYCYWLKKFVRMEDFDYKYLFCGCE